MVAFSVPIKLCTVSFYSLLSLNLTILQNQEHNQINLRENHNLVYHWLIFYTWSLFPSLFEAHIKRKFQLWLLELLNSDSVTILNHYEHTLYTCMLCMYVCSNGGKPENIVAKDVDPITVLPTTNLETSQLTFLSNLPLLLLTTTKF